MKNVIIIAVLLLLVSCSVLPKSPMYYYTYRDLSTGKINHSNSIVQYDKGDTIVMFPSSRKIVILDISLTPKR